MSPEQMSDHYRRDQIGRVLRAVLGDDPIRLKIWGGGSETKWMAISREEARQVAKLLDDPRKRAGGGIVSEVYVVRRGDDDIDIYGDYELAERAASAIGSVVETEPVLGIDFVKHLEATSAEPIENDDRSET